MSGPFAEMPAEERELLEARAAALAAVEEDEPRTAWTRSCCAVEKDRYALPVDSVREVVSDYRVTPVPCAPPAIRGVVNLRGEIVSVTDLAVVARAARRRRAVRPAPLVVVTDGAVTTALLVDAVEDIASVPRARDRASAPAARTARTRRRSPVRSARQAGPGGAARARGPARAHRRRGLAGRGTVGPSSARGQSKDSRTGRRSQWHHSQAPSRRSAGTCS